MPMHRRATVAGWPNACRMRPCTCFRASAISRAWCARGPRSSLARSRPSDRAWLEPGRAVLEQHAEAPLVDHGHPELLGLLRLGAGVLADHDVVGLLRHRAGGLAPSRQDR